MNLIESNLPGKDDRIATPVSPTRGVLCGSISEESLSGIRSRCRAVLSLDVTRVERSDAAPERQREEHSPARVQVEGASEVPKGAAESEEQGEQEGDEKESLELQEVSDEMQDAVVRLQFIAQPSPTFKGWYVYLRLAVLQGLCMPFNLFNIGSPVQGAQ